MADKQTTPPKRDGLFWIGLFLGGLIGALLIVIMGTEKGKKLVKKLQTEGLDFLDDQLEKVDENVEKLQDKGEQLIEQGKELIAEAHHLEKQVVEQVSEVKDQLTEQVVAHADQALGHIEKLQEHGRETTSELRRRLFRNIPKKG